VRLEELKDLVRLGAVDVALFRKGKRAAEISLAHVRNLLVALGTSRSELFGREANDDESLVLELLVKLFEAVELRGETALGGRVEDDLDLALVVLFKGEKNGTGAAKKASLTRSAKRAEEEEEEKRRSVSALRSGRDGSQTHLKLDQLSVGLVDSKVVERRGGGHGCSVESKEEDQ
jgi:hypothetical protein